jgi:hypothetical protein
MAVNPYAAPSADVNAEAVGDAGSVEGALAGNYDFTVEEVLKEAWRLNDGFKLTGWLTVIILGIATGIVSGLLAALVGKSMPGLIVRQIVAAAMGGIFSLGITTVTIRRAAGLPTSVGDAFSRFDQWLPAVIAGLLINLFGAIGFFLLIIPGIYLFVAYGMAVPLISDRKMGTWDAMETSRKAVSKKWFKVFLTLAAAGTLTVLSGLLLLIPLIWTLPWLCLVTGVIYRRMFGVATTQ